ncbi:viral innexin-g1.3 [Ichnoviriform fugitivi]|uniref:Viral innexin-g1.3 n=1 Tax=Ichnoviriform fugitivi TaxID=265522 RepID=A2Q0P7_9VIRU|nr:viral innexin-g1.3 [Ichnoviriform fugitivi]BAF45762.1 viral innexin-g1.3 [Ichnoviriform fugitivi]
MLHLLKALRGLLKPRSVQLHNTVFCLHYKFTVTFLIAFSIVGASQQYFGETIDCQFAEYKNGELNNYCSAQDTFVREQTANDGEGEEDTKGNRVRYYTYYSWVSLTLFLQAVFFYTPHYIWKVWEGGRLQALTSKIIFPILDKDAVEKGVEGLSEYFFKNRKTHNAYAYKHLICELLNLINIAGQIVFMNRFIGDGYQFYGIHVLLMNREDMEKRIGQLFPTRTICTFEKYGLTGLREKSEGICILTHNPLNEKIYCFLWFWMHFVAVVSVLDMIYRIVTILYPPLRFYLLRFTSCGENADEIRAVYEKLQFGEWFLLLLLHENVNSQVYEALISRLAQHFKPYVVDC